MSTDTFNYPIQQEQQKQNINNQKQSIQKNNKDDEQEEDDDEDDDDDDDDDDDESEQAQEIVCYPKKLEITPQGPQGGSQKDEFTMFKVKPIRQDQAQNQISPNQKMGQQQNTFQPTQQEKQKQYQEIQQTTKFYEATNQMKPDQKQTQLFIQKNQAEEETKYYDQFALKNGDYQSTTFDLTQQKQPLDWKLLDYIVTVSSKEQGQNFQYHKQEHELIYPDNPTKFVINISRIKDDNIKYNYIINSQDCSRNHIQILCDDQYRFYLGKNQGRNGTFIKSKEFEEITSNTELQVGNIFLEFKSVQIIENEEKAYLKINAFSITQQESYQEKQIEINKLNHFLIGRNHSTIFDLFQKDTQLSRKHGEIRLVQVDVFDANLNRNIKKWKVIFCQFAARNGSWIKISDKQYIGNDSIIKVGIQNFLHINISAQKPQKQFDLKALQPNCQNPCKLVQNYLLNCNLAYPKQTHSSEILIGLGCGHTFCKDCDQNHFQKLLKEENSQFLKKLCPICNQENNSCPLNLN